LVIAALFTAVIAVATIAIPIPLPGSGYANPGDALVIVAGCLLSPFWGSMAAGLGSMLADILLGSAAYAPATMLIKGLMAALAGFIFRRFAKKRINRMLLIICTAFMAEVVMVTGYFLYESFLFNQVIASLNLIGNIVQGLVGITLSAMLLPMLLNSKPIMNLLGLGGDR